MRRLALVLLLAACTPPPPPAPERAEPVEPVPIAVTVTGTVHHAAHGEAGFASVTVSRGESDCRPLRVLARTNADHRGRYSLDLEQAADCLIVEATAAGARGVASFLSRRASPPPPRIELDVRLDPPAPLTRADADALVASLRSAVNDNDESAMLTLAQHFFLDHDEAMRTGIEHLRIALGEIARSRLAEERPSDYVYEITGSSGATTRFGVQQYTGRIASNPMIHYGWRASRFVATFARLVAAKDAEKLARLLTADDVDYPVEKARRVIKRHAVLGELESARGVFTGIDERTSTLRYRIEGRSPGGTTARVPIELGYGDGLLWLRE